MNFYCLYRLIYRIKRFEGLYDFERHHTSKRVYFRVYSFDFLFPHTNFQILLSIQECKDNSLNVVKGQSFKTWQYI